MTEAEIAVALGINDRTVRRDWQKARLLLADALKKDLRLSGNRPRIRIGTTGNAGVAMDKYQIDVGSWEALNRLLDQALELPPTAIDPWLETLAAGVRGAQAAVEAHVVAPRTGGDRRLPEHAAEVRHPARKRATAHRATGRCHRPVPAGAGTRQRRHGRGLAGGAYRRSHQAPGGTQTTAWRLEAGGSRRAHGARAGNPRHADASEHCAPVRRGCHGRRPALPRHRVRRRHARRRVLPAHMRCRYARGWSCLRRPRRRWPMRTASW